MTPEDKAKLFKDNPNDFINLNDVIVASIRTPDGKLAIVLGNSKASELKISWANINLELTTTLMMMRAKAQADQKNKIISPHN